MILFFACYSYQVVYVIISMVKKDKNADYKAKETHKFAVLISARNESSVISGLLDSINKQNYPSELLDVYVVADNCDDCTAQICRDYGATVFERFDSTCVGKGYALDYAFSRIEESIGIDAYEGYLVFDADNVLDPNYISEMNRVFDMGYSVVTSYRNSKNYGTNWISAGYSLWFLRESKYLNGARMLSNTSCAISGTGFLVSSKIIKENSGWKHHLLTEDIEFTVDNVIAGRKIGYSPKAVVYDEQPVSFAVSWKQRMRWAKGFYQVLHRYSGKLLKQCIKNRSFQCFDMLMTIAPATILTLFAVIVNVGAVIIGLISKDPSLVSLALRQIAGTVGGVYFSLLFFGVITTITEWNNIYCHPTKKIFYMFTFPIFILTYIPIAISALLKRVTWEQIPHTIKKDVSEIQQ